MSEPTTSTMRIRDWERRFEVNRTRELKIVSWRPEPINSDLYVEVVSHPDGAAHYGVLTALRNIAAKANPRGSLTREGGRAHDAQSLARLTRIPEPLMRAAIERLIEIGEIEIPTSQGGATIPHRDATIPHPQNEAPHEGAETERDSAQYRTGKTGRTGSTDRQASARSARGVSPISPEEARLTDEQILASWNAAGFDGPEDFEAWFRAVYEAHPTRGALQLAKDGARNAILAGELTRGKFETSYEAYRCSPEWQRNNGRFIPQLAKLICDRFWEFPPVTAAAEEVWA